jgi:hypothetical protein
MIALLNGCKVGVGIQMSNGAQGYIFAGGH